MIYRSENFSLDTQSYTLIRNGERCAIEPQVFDLLVYLIENRDRVVTRNELLDNLWSGRVVSDSALNGRLKIARKAVGDNGKQQKIIKTIHRRGYQFIAEVESNSVAGEEKPLLDDTQPSFPSKPSIVVLPFENLGDEQDGSYFADGLTKDIIANLCRYRELFVIDWQSAFRFRDSNASVDNFARQVAVEYIARGNIRRTDARIRISAELVEAASGRVIWADKLERSGDNLFDLEDEVSSKIASSLAGYIDNDSAFRAATKPTESMTAYDYVLRARQFSVSFDKDDIETMRTLLAAAIDLDPKYALARAYLGLSYILEYESEWCNARERALELALEHAREAMAIDEFDAFAHMIMGWALLYRNKFDLAEAHLNRAIECNPNDHDSYCIKSWVLAFTGRSSEAHTCATQALRLNPLVPDQCLAAMSLALYIAGDYDSAIEILDRIDVPGEQSESLRAACLYQSGRKSEASRTAARAIEMGGEFLQQRDWLLLWPFKHRRDLEHFLDGLYKSGVLRDPAIGGEKPSLAILKFNNLSSDPEQQYFSEGITANVYSRLSRIRSLKIVSGLHYETRDKSPTQIAAELGVGYLLSGSVQREGERVRLMVELLDGHSGEVKWSDSFERCGHAVMDLQGDVGRAVTGTIWSSRGSLREAEREKMFKKISEDFNAFDYVLQGQYFKESYSVEGLSKAHDCFERAVRIDPGCAEALGWNAWVHIVEVVLGYAADRDRSIELAIDEARKAIAIDPYSEMGHWALADALVTRGDYEAGIAQFDKAIEINPNNPDLIVTKGTNLAVSGHHEEGLALIDEGIAFNRHPPEWYYWHKGIACFAARKFQDAIGALICMDSQNKDSLTYLAASHAHCGNLVEAANQLAELFAIDPETSVENIAESHFWLSAETLDLLLEGIKLAMDDRKPQKLNLV